MSIKSLTAINTGSFALDGGAMFGRVPKALWSQQYPCDAQNRIPLALRCLAVRWSDGRTLLVDTGAGDKYSDKQKAIYNFQPKPNAFASNGISEESVTDVLLTHLHFDHCGGSTRRTANGEIVATFPKAKYYIGTEHYAYARQPSLLDRASFMPDNYQPLVAMDRAIIIEPPMAPWSGVKLLQFFGHTRGILLPLINIGNKTVFFAGDLIPTRRHVRLAWIMGYDLDADETLGEKSFILELAAENQWGIFLEHDHEVELITVKRDLEDYALEKTWKLEEFLAS